MNSEVTLEQLREARVLEISGDPANGFIIAEACDEYFSVAVSAQQLAALGREMIALSGVTTPPASGGVVGVQEVSNLLAVIHGDGGHYQHEHGTAKAATDALAKYSAIQQHLAEAAPKQAMGWLPSGDYEPHPNPLNRYEAAAQPLAPEGGGGPAAGAVVVDDQMVERAIRAYESAYFASSKDTHQSFRAALTAAIGGG